MIIPSHLCAVLVLLLDLAASKEGDCWNDYQLGLDDSGAKAREAGRITVSSFQCNLNLGEVRSRLPTGNSCYETGVRNGALWTLQALAVANQCTNNDFFGDQWTTERIPESMIQKGLQAVDQFTGGMVSKKMKTLKAVFVPKFLQKSSGQEVSNDSHQDLPSSMNNINSNDMRDGAGRRNQIQLVPPEQFESQSGSNSINMESVRQVPVVSGSSDSPISNGLPSESPLILQPITSETPPLSAPIPDMSQTATATGATISSKKITQQERHVISGDDKSTMSNSDTSGNSLLIPSHSIASTNVEQARPAKESHAPRQQITVKTFESNSKTIV